MDKPTIKQASSEDKIDLNEDFTFTFDDDSSVMPSREFDERDVTPTLEPDVKEEEKEPEVEEGISEELETEYLMIYDSIMFEDKFEKTYRLGKKYSATFVTRSAAADAKVGRQLDSMNIATVQVYQMMSALFTMSYSLSELNGKDLSKMSATDRLAFVQSKSSHMIELLSRHMVAFDCLVRDALEYGEGNF